jgi:non-specific serine/threonine protein kinase
MQFAHALMANQRVGARPLTARTQLEYGKVLVQLGRGDEGRAQIGEAISEFEALGMAVCLERARAALDEVEGASATVVESGGGEEPSVGAMQEGVFRSDGDYWTVSFAGKTARIKNVRGLHYIAYLLERANQPVYALDLAVLGRQPGETGMDSAVARQESLQVADLKGRGAILDERARVEYRGRLRELVAERDEVERLNDYGHLARIDEEIEAIEACLIAGSGPKGRIRRWTAPAERARVNVRNSIAKALRTIAQHHEPLHRHLQNSIKTGAVCSYVPEQGVGWQVTGS